LQLQDGIPAGPLTPVGIEGSAVLREPAPDTEATRTGTMRVKVGQGI
jgi:hypothetical protein